MLKSRKNVYIFLMWHFSAFIETAKNDPNPISLAVSIDHTQLSIHLFSDLNSCVVQISILFDN